MDGLLIGAVTALVLVIIGLGETVVTRRRRRATRRALRPIADLKNGDIACIKGSTFARAPLRTSPILQRRCIGYRLVVSSNDDAGARRIIEEDAFDPFVVADGTGQALVHPPFDLQLTPDTRSSGQNLPPGLYEILEQKGVRTHGIQGETRILEYVETVLLPGDEIIVRGQATIEVDPGGRSTHREPPVICHLKGADEKVVIAEPDAALVVSR